MNILGGTLLGGITAGQAQPLGGRVDIYGGSFPGGSLLALGTGVITITGSGFNLPLGDIVALNGHLTGTLASGELIGIDFGRTTSARIILAAVTDSDSDGIADGIDNCIDVPNPAQVDTDGNGLGDACNDSEDADGDEYADNLDNCPNTFNPGQEDADGDGIGDVCDPFPNDPDNAQAQCDLNLAQCQLNLGQCLADQCPVDLVQCNADLVQSQVDLGQCNADLAQSESDLAQCLASPGFTDTDGDGEEDSTDACPGTASAAEVDDAGCSVEQFCNSVDASAKGGKKLCKRSDWKNDEPVMKSRDRDCAFDKGGPERDDDTCVAAP